VSEDLPEISDRPVERLVVDQQVRHVGSKWRLVTDDVELPGGIRVRRDVVIHPGAVGIVALDEQDQVVLVCQYRHPVGAALWELPAGLLDEVGESALDTARRELFEEAHLRAREWHLLIDLYSSPGMSSEIVRVFLARGLVDVPPEERHVQTEEEADMPVRRVPLNEACTAAQAGRLHSAMAVAGLFAAAQAREQGWARLRPADEPWPVAR